MVGELTSYMEREESSCFNFFFRTYREAVVPAPKKNFTISWVSFPEIVVVVMHILNICRLIYLSGANVCCLVVDLPWSSHRACPYPSLLGQLSRCIIYFEHFDSNCSPFSEPEKWTDEELGIPPDDE